MGQNRIPPQNQQSVSTVKSSRSPVTARQPLRFAHLGNMLAGAWALVAAIATVSNSGLVQLIESQTQTLFFEIRGPIAPTNNVVILAIDQQSLSVPEQYYRTNPQQYSSLKPLQAWPWQRQAYAQAIAKLMAAGARAVALDIVFANPSSYGAADDRQLAQVLQRYAGRVTLAALYEESELRQGRLLQLTQPQRLFWTKPASIGFVNFPLEPDGQIHRFASAFPKLLADKYQQQFQNFEALKVAIPSFEQAVVAAAEEGSGGGQGSRGAEGQRGRGAEEKSLLASSHQSKGDYIYFYGPAGTFEQIPFWHVLDPDNWNTYLQQGKYFKDKIVIIGATATSLSDFHKAPFSQSWLYPQPMSGVEIQANAIASLLEKRTIAQAFPNPTVRGLFVLLFVAGTAVLLTKAKSTGTRFGWAMGIAIAWGSISYAAFIHQQLILPTAVPAIALVLCGCSYLLAEALSNNWRKNYSRRSWKQYDAFPFDQKASVQQDDLQDLLQQRELVTVGKILSQRYKVVKVLGSGGFSETYVAEDLQRPGNPLCVVKQLKPASNQPQHLQLARRLFQLEAESLEKLGKHDQIPQLLAYFEQDQEFYLVQELIVGHPLSWELKGGKPISEGAVIEILGNLLEVLEFVHGENVIHRDIKPSNIIRRHSDRKLVLIDFGAVKRVSTQLLEPNKQTSLTVSVGTQGYAPSEQSAGHAFFSTDIYALGMTAIKAVTGLHPHELPLDAKTGEVIWKDKAQISPELAEILSIMVRYDFRQRYRSASEALSTLKKLVDASTQSLVSGNSFANNAPAEDLDTPTAIWVCMSTEIPDPATRPRPT